MKISNRWMSERLTALEGVTHAQEVRIRELTRALGRLETQVEGMQQPIKVGDKVRHKSGTEGVVEEVTGEYVAVRVPLMQTYRAANLEVI